MKTEGNRTKRSIDMFDGKNQHLVGAQTSNSDDSETHCAGSARWCPGFASSCPESTASGSGSSNITTAPLAEVEDNGKSLQHSLGIIKDGHDSDRYQYPMQAQQRFTAMGLASESRSDTPERGQQFLGDSSVVFFLEQIADPSETDVEKTSSVTTTLCGNINTSTIYSSRTMEPPRLEINSEELPPRQLADHLLNCYFDKIHSLYPFVHKNSFSRAYKLIWSPEYQTSDASFTTGIGLGDPTVSPAMFLCALNVIFALGCQFITLDRSARKAASEKFFQRSQRLQNLTCLDEGNISTVQTLLLASQYLQGVGSPAKCWNLIGLACRMAQGLGLHSDKADKDRLPAELQMRRRIWHGCVMQDLASSMMLGRPPMTHISTVPLPEALDDEYLDFALPPRSQSQSNISRVEFYVRNLQLYEILRKILSRVYGSPVDGNKPAETEEEFERVSTVMELDSELLRFKSGLPEALKWNDMDSPCEVPEQFRRESNLLKARLVSSFEGFALAATTD
ncbi:hypothetical protein N7535_008728 [Penicillium sp. DV-2018c]|nr:hypothetical protein N7461_002485 [Penicillium sp. DV-2018c]KAJ5563564.1 hypothetical protein N7535_008728 [Penicillium sp. DV-2018c]